MLNVNDVNQIYLGCQGENLARTIIIDVKPWLVAYPGGTVTIWHKRNGAEEATATGAVFDSEAGTITWRPTGTDTYVFGEGEAEIRLTVGNVIKKSRTIKTDVARAVTGADGEALVSGWQGYLDAIQRAAGVAITKNGLIQFAVNAAGHLILSYTEDVPIPAEESDETTEEGDIVWIDKDLGKVTPSDEQVQAAANTYLATVITNPDSPPLDRSLSSNVSAAPADMVGDLKSALSDEETARINTDTNLQNKKVNQPLDEYNQPTDGTDGQLLRTKGDGSTEWSDVGQPTDAQTAQAVSDWLDAHPEATTTVQDGSITIPKISSNALEKLFFANNIEENINIESTVTSSDAYKTYFGKTYEINSSIVLTNRDKVFNKIIAGATFILNTTMFTWTAQYMPIPDFVDCVFIGNENYIIDNGLYCTKSKFINCIFYDCGIINNGDELQSARFINCRFVGTTKLISAKVLNDFEMDSCQFESDFNACIVDTSSYDKNGFTSVQTFRVINTIIEGQSQSTNVLFKISQGGQIFFDKCYFEQVMCGLLDIVATQNPPSNPIMSLSVTNCKFSVGRRPFINIAPYFENGNRVYVDISNNHLTDTQNNAFISTETFKNILIQNNILGTSYITLENQKSLSDLENDVSTLEKRSNIKVIDFWVDGTLSASNDTTINSYGPQLGVVFDTFANPDRLKYTNIISFAVVEKGKDSNNADPVNGVWLRQRLYGNTGYADYLEVLQTSNNAMVTAGKYRIRIAYTD